MDSVEKEKAVLISSIETDARTEVEKIIAEAEQKAAEKKLYGEKKVESMLSEARQKAGEQAEAARKKIVSGAEIEAKRRSMQAKDEIMRQILRLAEEKLRSMIDSPDYPAALEGWIKEAAIGLDAQTIRVNASQKEQTLIDETVLSRVSAQVLEQTGKKVALTLSDELPLADQGVVLTAEDGRTAFNNQIKTRMQRNQRKIRMEIYNALFSDDGKEKS